MDALQSRGRGKGRYLRRCSSHVEDIGLALGQALVKALGDKAGIERYGDAWVPMDEALTQVVIDLSGRPYLVFQGEWSTPVLGGNFEAKELVEDFFQALAMEAAA